MAFSNHMSKKVSRGPLIECVGHCLSDDRGGIEDWSRSKRTACSDISRSTRGDGFVVGSDGALTHHPPYT